MTKSQYLALVYRYKMGALFDSDGEFVGTGYDAWHLVDELDEIQHQETSSLGDVKVGCYMFDSGKTIYTFIPPAEWLHDTATLIDWGPEPDEE